MRKQFIFDRRGNIALLSAFLLPIVLCFVGAAVDFYRWFDQKSELKEMADALATRGAREFLLANASAAQVKAVINAAYENGIASIASYERPQIDVQVDVDKQEVTVAFVAKAAQALFLSNFEPYKSGVTLQSTAVARGGSNVCVIALDPTAPQTISLDTSSKLTGETCYVHSNSASTKSLVAVDSTKISAEMICSSGGYTGGVSNFDPMPITDCPHREDPLFYREAPVVEACTSAPGYYRDVRIVLEPGVYCGGLMVEGNSTVEFRPGIYVMKNGRLFLGDGVSASGDNISFHFTERKGSLYIAPNTSVRFSASVDGPLAGILMFQDRAAPDGASFQIASNDASVLVGTIYLPKARLYINAANPVADQSAYTAIVAGTIQLSANANLVLNTNYDQTPVPVPTGMGPVGGETYLRE